MIQAIASVLIVAVLAVSLWFNPGPEHGGFTIGIVLVSVTSALFLGSFVAKTAPPGWFVISRRTASLFRFAGALRFGQLLRRLGWNRVLHGTSSPVSSPSDVVHLAPKLRASASGHAVGGVLHLGAGVAALIVGEVMTAVWILVVAVPLHAYPVMLQLLQLHRMQRVLMTHRARGTRV